MATIHMFSGVLLILLRVDTFTATTGWEHSIQIPSGHEKTGAVLGCSGRGCVRVVGFGVYKCKMQKRPDQNLPSKNQLL